LTGTKEAIHLSSHVIHLSFTLFDLGIGWNWYFGGSKSDWRFFYLVNQKIIGKNRSINAIAKGID